MSEKIQPISNPELKGAIESMHAGEHSREAQMVTLQLLLKAQLLAPVSVTHEKGDAQIHFQLLTTQDGRVFLPAFTDLQELHKGFADPEQKTLVLTFSDYKKMILTDGAAAGVVVDPFSHSLTLERPLVEFLSKVQEEQK